MCTAALRIQPRYKMTLCHTVPHIGIDNPFVDGLLFLKPDYYPHPGSHFALLDFRQALARFILALTSLFHSTLPRSPSVTGNMSSQAGTWLKMAGVGIVICVGGPALVQKIRPTDAELIERYNPDLKKRSMEEGDKRAKEFDEYVTKLKQWSKSDKSIWIAAQEMEEQRQAEQAAQRNQAKEDEKKRREEMRKELLGGK
ncbi:CBP4-domain-containing protein [Aspergillus egyptiacus]|nr:CBP4-domain-containing protein [Aspergillus egyptiacus]